MKKSERQRHIQEIISNQYVERQEDLVKLLAKSGIRVTQATISRDIKDMQLLKGRRRLSLQPASPASGQ